jgi:hypothetical protein
VVYGEHHVRRRLEARVLFRVHRGVYAVTGARDSLEFRVIPGAASVAQLVDERREGKRPCETGLEDQLLEVFAGFEADGDAHHKGLLDRTRDEAWDEQCRLVGWTVRRYSTDDVRLRPAGIAEDVLRLRARALAA